MRPKRKKGAILHDEAVRLETTKASSYLLLLVPQKKKMKILTGIIFAFQLYFLSLKSALNFTNQL